MSFVLNGIATIDADFYCVDEGFVAEKYVSDNDERDAFLKLFDDKSPHNIEFEGKYYKLIKTGSSYAYKNNDSGPTTVSVNFRSFTSEDEEISMKRTVVETLALMLGFADIRINAIQKILKDKGIIQSEDELIWKNIFSKEEMNKLTSDFTEEMDRLSRKDV